MVSKPFLDILAGRRQQATGETLPAAMNAIAASYGYSTFEELMTAESKGELDDDVRANLFRDLSPYIDLAYGFVEQKSERPKDWVEALDRIFSWIRRFLFGFTQEEWAEFQADAELSAMLARVETAQQRREKHLACSAQLQMPAGAQHQSRDRVAP